MVKSSCCGVTENCKEQERQSGSKDAVYEWKIDMPRRHRHHTQTVSRDQCESVFLQEYGSIINGKRAAAALGRYPWFNRR
jgi:hypothetical protein